MTQSSVAMEMVSIAIRVLSARLLALVAIGVSAFLFIWTIIMPDWIRLISAVAFSVIVFVYLSVASSRGKHEEST